MREIKIISPQDIEVLYELERDTYPSIFLSKHEPRKTALAKLAEIQMKTSHPFYGYYRQGGLVGGMRLFDFVMNVYGKMVSVGGVGSISVNLLYKKEKIARDLIEHFIRFHREKGVSLVFLYAFRHDFYKKMGFGYGTRAYEYQVSPSVFPYSHEKHHLIFVTKNEVDDLVACDHRLVEKSHGMIRKDREYFEDSLEGTNKKLIAFKSEGDVLGYLIFSPQKVDRQNVLISNLIVHEWAYENTTVMKEFMTFLHSQSDQFEKVIFETHDDDFFYMLNDPRNHTQRMSQSLFHESHTTGIGMMVRIINPSRAIVDIQNRQFGMDEMRIQFVVEDSLLKETSTVGVSFSGGRCSLSDEAPDVHVTMDISDYSSLLFGSISFERLYRYGLIRLSDEAYRERLGHLLTNTQRPVCTVPF